MLRPIKHDTLNSLTDRYRLLVVKFQPLGTGEEEFKAKMIIQRHQKERGSNQRWLAAVRFVII